MLILFLRAEHRTEKSPHAAAAFLVMSQGRLPSLLRLESRTEIDMLDRKPAFRQFIERLLRLLVVVVYAYYGMCHDKSPIGHSNDSTLPPHRLY